MLQINDIHKTYGDDVILEGVSLIVNPGDRLGLVGPNGCGKTTLLKIVVGQEAPDKGSVSFTPPDLRIGYLEQALSYPEGATVAAVMRGGLADPEREIRDLAERMSRASGEELDRLMAAYAHAVDRFEARGGYGGEAQMDALLAGLGLDAVDRDTPVEQGVQELP